MDLDKGNNRKKRGKNRNARIEVIELFSIALRFFGCKTCSSRIFLIYYSRRVGVP